MRELLFIHGAGGAVDDPEFGSQKLIAFLKRTLAQDYRIRAPLMPNPENHLCLTRKSHYLRADS